MTKNKKRGQGERKWNKNKVKRKIDEVLEDDGATLTVNKYIYQYLRSNRELSSQLR